MLDVSGSMSLSFAGESNPDEDGARAGHGRSRKEAEQNAAIAAAQTFAGNAAPH